MINRYSSRIIFNNDLDLYKQYFKDRNVKFIKHYSTPSFYYPNSNEITNIQLLEHTWTVGDRYSKLADTYYGDPKSWWVIAKFNQKPTESHLTVGDIILIPTPLTVVLKYR